MKNSLLEFWNRCPIKKAPYIHPDDIAYITEKRDRYIVPGNIRTFEKFKDSKTFGRFDEQRFHLSLLPVPYGGNIAEADIIILLLNPGLAYSDYYGESKIPLYRKAQENNLRQKFSGSDFPFHNLNPDLCWHGGFSWWEKKLRSVITKIADQKFRGSYFDALSSLSHRLADVPPEKVAKMR